MIGHRRFANATDPLRLLDDVLDLSYVGLGKLVLEVKEFDLHNLLTELAFLLGGGERAETVELLMEVAPDVRARLCGDTIVRKEIGGGDTGF
nr:hypothetical protein [uncultured Duganella sp.]